MTVSQPMSDLIHSAADQHTETQTVIRAAAPVFEDAFQSKSTDDENADDYKVGDKNHTEL